MPSNHSYITTSWDDGHVLDMRIAELLCKYGLTGTFYVPREASTGVMDERQVCELAETFEIGAHTMRHTFLDTVDDSMAEREISQSRKWIEDVTGRPCALFCPPGGKFRPTHLRQIEAAGFTAIRTVELLSLGFPRPRGKLLIMPTTVQAYPHRHGAYARNALKRFALANLWRYIRYAESIDWTGLARRLLQTARAKAGVFHLWGHSWEIENAGQWARLEEAFGFIAALTNELPCVSNGTLCRLGSLNGKTFPNDKTLLTRPRDPESQAAGGPPAPRTNSAVAPDIA